jgi:flagellar biosynthesis/type III secretory pathway chaperone
VFILEGCFTVDKINEVLGKECEVYEDILELSKSKKDAIMNGKISDLEKILAIEQTLLVKAGRMRNQREALTEHLAEERGIDKQNVNISALLDVTNEQEAAELDSTRKKFLDVLSRLDDSNKLNSTLIEHSLEYINFSINLLNFAGVGSEGYGKSGRVKEGRGKNYLDLRL